MSEALYLECASGISGDMFVGAMLDLGVDEKKLTETLKSIPVEGAEIFVSRVMKSGLDVCDFRVALDAEHENHDHDMEYLHGHASGHQEQEHVHGHSDSGAHAEHTHSHSDSGAHAEHVHDHSDGGVQADHRHSHIHRGLPEILELLRSGSLTEGACQMAEKIFRILAEAEAKAHGVPPEQVHFHEVGAVDSILDIAAAAICLDELGIREVYLPQICEGRGTVRCQHGVLPVPVPAVSNIAAAYGLPLRIDPVEGEFVTPTGAAIAAAICTRHTLPDRFVIRKIGMGAGKRTYEKPGLLRIFQIETEDSDKTETGKICKLEANLDDCTGEVLGYTLGRLMEAGARDVHYMPVYMKKNRPGWQLNVICDLDKKEELEDIIFSETTTIGIRQIPVERTVLQRSMECLDTEYGEVRIKRCSGKGLSEHCYPEYEDVARLARTHGMPFRDMYSKVILALDKRA